MRIDDEIIKIRRQIHSCPELGGNEHKTAKFIESKLKEYKIPFKRIAETGVTGILKTTKPGKTLALRADIDALPMKEENKLSYKSKNDGVMHACGHDANTAIILGAAKILSENKAKLKGNIKFIFQPKEETSDGAESLIRAGVLKNPKPDAVIGVHVIPWLESGKIGLKYGEMMAAVDRLQIEFDGEIAHGAYPHLGKDALVAASFFINSVQTIVSREINPVGSVVVTFGKINGGDAYNILCKRVVVEGTVRTLNDTVRKAVKESIIRKLKAVEISFGIKCNLLYQHIASPLINDRNIVEFCYDTSKDFYGEKNSVILEHPSMGGDDFAEYLRQVPGNYIYIGTRKDKSTSYPWHHSKFNVDEKALPKAARYIAYTAERFLER